MQGDDNCIVEHAYSASTGWEMCVSSVCSSSTLIDVSLLLFRGLFKAETVPNADICAVVRNVGGAAGNCLSLMWAGQDKVRPPLAQLLTC